VIADNLSGHDSKSTQAWLEDHPRIRHSFVPGGACWLSLQEGWWRIFRRRDPRQESGLAAAHDRA
jgi:hypothetical protein